MSSFHVDLFDYDHHLAVGDAPLHELRQDVEEREHHVDHLPHASPAHHLRIVHQEAEEHEAVHQVEEVDHLAVEQE